MSLVMSFDKDVNCRVMISKQQRRVAGEENNPKAAVKGEPPIANHVC
jgi:hypothetical protein